MKELELIFAQKEKESENAARRAISSEVEEVRSVLKEELNRERLHYRKLE